MNDCETIADIVADLQQEASDCPDIERAGIYDRYADRLEAAWKREKAEIEAAALEAGGVVEAARQKPVGDAAAMREAMLKVSSSLCPACRRRNCKGCPRAVAEFMSAVRKALILPPRNCDLFDTKDKSREAFQKLRGHCVWADVSLWDDRDEIEAFLDWLFAPATEQKGATK